MTASVGRFDIFPDKGRRIMSHDSALATFLIFLGGRLQDLGRFSSHHHILELGRIRYP